MCSSQLSVSIIEAAFTTQSISVGSGVPTPTDKLNLLTALAVAPGFVVQKVTTLTHLCRTVVQLSLDGGNHEIFKYHNTSLNLIFHD